MSGMWKHLERRKERALRIAKITYRNIEESVGRDARVKAANKLSKV